METKLRGSIDIDDFRNIIASSVDGFTQVDASGQIIDVNESYCQMLGYNREEILGMHISEVDIIDNADDVAKRSEEIIQKKSLRFETKHLHKDGSVLDVE